MAVVFARAGPGGRTSRAAASGATRSTGACAQGYTEGLSALLGGGRPSSPGEHRRQHSGRAAYHADRAGTALKLTVAPKGFGSENMSRMIYADPRRGPGRRSSDCVVEAVRAGGKQSLPAHGAGRGHRRGLRALRAAGQAGALPRRWISRTPIPSTPDMEQRHAGGGQSRWASGRRASAALPRPLGGRHREPIPPTSPGCRWRSTSAAT